VMGPLPTAYTLAVIKSGGSGKGIAMACMFVAFGNDWINMVFHYLW